MFLASLPLLLAAVFPQQPSGDFDLINTSHWDGLGMTVFFLDDLNGDGFLEFGSSAFCTDFQGTNSGSVYIYDGRTQTEIRRHDGQSAKARLGEFASGVGDVDGDGFRDYAAGARNEDFGAPDAGSVYVWSGRTGALLHRFDGTHPNSAFGLSFASIPDVNGDGFQDLLIGAPEERSNHGAVYLFSGQSGRLLAYQAGVTPGGRFGWSMSSIGDISGDGVVEVIVSAPFADQQRGEVVVLKGRTLVPVSSYRSDDPWSQFGHRVRGVGDVNGDGQRDVLIGQPCRDTVFVFTPSSQSMVRKHRGPVGSAKAGYGHSLSRAGDVNQDGHPDYLLGHPGEWEGITLYTRGGGAEIYSGRDGSVLEVIVPVEQDDAFGQSVAFNPDAQSGQVSILIGSPAGGDLIGNHAPGIVSGRVIH